MDCNYADGTPAAPGDTVTWADAPADGVTGVVRTIVSVPVPEPVNGETVLKQTPTGDVMVTYVQPQHEEGAFCEVAAHTVRVQAARCQRVVSADHWLR